MPRLKVELKRSQKDRDQYKIWLKNDILKEKNIDYKKVIATIRGMSFPATITYMERVRENQDNYISGVMVVPKRVVNHLKLKKGQELNVKIEKDKGF